MNKEVFMQVGARHIGQLGRELVTDYVTALTELVKNSYDADAEAVEIRFENLRENDGRIIILDTGNGITSNDIIKKWAVIGTNNKIKDSYSSKYKRRYAGKKGIGRFAVERLAEHCTIVSFTDNERFEYFNNWNLYEGINIPEFEQRCEILKYSDDISSAKYLKCVIEYLLLTDAVLQEDKSKLLSFLGTSDISFKLFLGNALWLSSLERLVLPIMEKYKDNEQMVQEVGSVMSDNDTGKLESFYDSLKQVYKSRNIKKENVTGTIMVLDHLRDQWNQTDIEKIIKELILLVAPSKTKDNNFKISISAEEFPNLERIELTNDVLDMAYAEVQAYFSDEEIDGTIKKQFVIQYKEFNSDKVKIKKEDVMSPFLCGDFKLHLSYFLRDQKYLKKGSINQTMTRKILDTFCGVKIYRDGFRVRPYGDMGNDWLYLDSRKIKDTHGYLVGNNQLIGEVEVSQEENPLLVDSTNREAIIENESFAQLKNYVLKAISLIQNVRYEEFKEQDKKNSEEQAKREAELKRQRARSDKSVKKYLRQINEAVSKGNIHQVADISTQLIGVVADERQKSNDFHKNTKQFYESQLVSKERELSLYKNLASLGILAGSFGHETGDVFSRINNDIGYLRDICDLNGIVDASVVTCFNRLDKDLNRVSSYSKLLLSFLKKSKREKIESFNWGATTKSLVELYRRILESFNIKLETQEIHDLTSPVKMYQIDFESIIINLITNAFEAVKNKENRIIKISILGTESTSSIVVEDSGNGVPEDKLEWIFEPFNTTKKEDGVGLGLTILNDLVDKYKGNIEIGKSSLGGAKFIISFDAEGSHD